MNHLRADKYDDEAKEKQISEYKCNNRMSKYISCMNKLESYSECNELLNQYIECVNFIMKKKDTTITINPPRFA